MLMEKTRWRERDVGGLTLSDFPAEDAYKPAEVVRSEKVERGGKEVYRYLIRFVRRPSEENYSKMVVAEVRKKYTVEDEISLLRQRDTKVDEFAEYNAYVEECKEKAREALGVPEQAELRE